MISIRFRFACLLFAAAWCGEVSAQQPDAGSGTGTSTGTSTGTGSSSSTGSGASSAFGSPFSSPATGSAPGTGTGTGAATSGASAPAASAELPPPIKAAESGPTTFSISTGYGRAPELFTAGEGRLTRPRFSAHVSASIGFDDNIFQTATYAEGTPDVVIEQQITAGTAAQIVLVEVPDPRPQPVRIGVIKPVPRPPLIRRVFIPAVDPEFQEIVIPGTPKPKRQASAISRESISFEAQTSTRRTVFTFDMNVNSDYYWNRPGKKAEYNGSMAIRYLHRFTPRLQMTASVDAAYLSQPDLSQINLPTRTGNGNYLTLSAKSDLSYRWAPRFSTVTSLGINSLNFEEKIKQGSDYVGFTLGNEFRFLWKPKVTAVVEGRYGHISYPNNPTLDSTSYYGLLGLDVSLSRRAFATIRTGVSVRSFDESGGSSMAPYLETTLNYQLTRRSSLSWSNRFGFEEPPDPNTEVLTFRSGVSVSHIFGPRLRGSLSINAIHRSTTNDLSDTQSTEDTLDSGLSFLYTLTRKWSFNLNYNYTAVFTDPANSDYFRDRLFAGFDYTF